MGPPRTHPMDSPIGVECHVRDRFHDWLATKPSAGELTAALKRKSWRDDQIICPATYWAFGPADLETLQREIARPAHAPQG